MTLEMSPEDLGALLITLTLEGDSASVQIQTETPEAARLLADAERNLAQDFARQGVTLSSHDAQAGRRGDQPGRSPGQSARLSGPDQDSPPAAHMSLRGIINLIA